MTTSNIIKTIQDPDKIQALTHDLIKSAKVEILGIFSTANAFHRQERAGSFSLLKEVAGNFDIKVRILTPFDDKIENTEKIWKDDRSSGFQIRRIEQGAETKVSILLVDRRFSLAVELKDDSKESSLQAVGLATYSDSPPTVLSYVSIFESLWQQSELYAKLKIHERLQNEFISMAAHELRTPIQPVLALSQYLKSDPSMDVQQRQEYLDVIVRSAHRLQQLTEDILDITRIERNSLQLKMEILDIGDIIQDSLQEAKSHLQEKKIKLEFRFLNNIRGKDSGTPEGNIISLVRGDRRRLVQVLSNLINNSIKYTTEGKIEVIVEQAEKLKNKGKAKSILVKIRDTGSGIDPNIMPTLFSKFATNSVTGTGLGLFISKGIIEAHGGSIWAENNPEGKGATISFMLPASAQKEDSSADL